MRTILSRDDDIFACACTRARAHAHAERERISIGEAVSWLARRGIVAPGSPRVARAQPKSKYALLPARDEVITSEAVRALLDQQGIWPASGGTEHGDGGRPPAPVAAVGRPGRRRR